MSSQCLVGESAAFTDAVRIEAHFRAVSEAARPEVSLIHMYVSQIRGASRALSWRKAPGVFFNSSVAIKVVGGRFQVVNDRIAIWNLEEDGWCLENPPHDPRQPQTRLRKPIGSGEVWGTVRGNGEFLENHICHDPSRRVHGSPLCYKASIADFLNRQLSGVRPALPSSLSPLLVST